MIRLAAWLLLCIAGAPALLSAQDSHQCTVDHTAPGEGDQAMARGDYVAAEHSYAEALAHNPADTSAIAGQVRALLGQNRRDDALALATSSLAAHPNNATLETAMGDVALRRGEPEVALQHFSVAVHADPCLARVHYDLSRFLNLTGMAATARKQLEVAHALAPANPTIERAYRNATAVPLTPEQLIARLQARADAPNATPDEKDGALEAIKRIQSRQRGDCEAVHPVESTTLEMQKVANGPAYPVYGVGLDVLMNGKHKRLEIDTGASGLLISRGSAISAGLVPEAEIQSRGIGDRGPAGTFVTHVDDLRIGGMEFHNCVVRVLEKRSALEVDGLIGTDVFRNYLVTLDTPSLVMRLDPLPKRPDEAVKPTALATTGESAEPASGAPARPAPQDRYIAPEMKDWTRIYRVGHDLLIPTYFVLPTGVGSGPPRLFIMDTGAATPLLSVDAAREVTHVGSNSNMHIKGISGEVKNVQAADTVTLQFAGVRQLMRGATSIDTSAVSRDVGMEVAGFIAFPTLSELIVTIDYRDDLLHVVYDPKHGMHAH